MAATATGHSSAAKPEPVFATTRWSQVVAAGCGDSAEAHDALAHLCETYWYPLYAYARRRGNSPHDAQDLTQEFFARLLEGNWLAQADPERGRFRTFLLSSMKNFLANEWSKAHAQKRGGRLPVFSLDDDSAEQRYLLEPVEKATPETLFERAWALALLNGVLARLEQEFAGDGKTEWMEAMRPALTTDSGRIRYPEIATKLGITETAARVAVHRIRQRYRRLIRAEVAGTVAAPGETDEELRHLFEVLGGK